MSSFFSKGPARLAALVCLLLPGTLQAVQLSAIYSSPCEREVGIILHVDDTKVRLLNLGGEVKSIKRFDIIYIAHYPMGKVTIPKIEPAAGIRITEIKTLYKNRVVPLLRGWMTNYSENKISFLTTEGIETVIDTADVWDIRFEEQNATITFKENGPASRFFFVHPYPFIGCETDQTQGLRIYPHHLLETPLLIKTELDRLQAGYETLQSYVKEKVFYPKPQLYTNKATLGIWAGANHRHGSSSGRNSSFIPVVRNELSEGLYRFQRVVVTGTAPMPYSVHEEPQTQLYYSMKSSYFHLSLMYDLIQLISSDYKWQKEDMKGRDDRQNETLHVAAGFDYGNYAIEFAIVDLNYGIRHDSLFHAETMDMGRWGFFYTHRLFQASLYIGNGGDEDEKEEEQVPPDDADQGLIDYYEYLNQQQQLKPDFQLQYGYARLNLAFPGLKKLQPNYSLIYKEITFDKQLYDGTPVFKYEGRALTNALYLHYDLQEDLFIDGFISVEMTQNRSGISRFEKTSQNNYLKGGISLGLVF